MKDETKEFSAALPRKMVMPTDERLRAETTEAVNILHAVWDGEVEVVVAMVRKGSSRVTWATSAPDRERLKYILNEIKVSSAHMALRMSKNKVVLP